MRIAHSFLILLAALTCATSFAQSSFSGDEFHSLSYPPRTIDGVTYPRNEMTLYRGTIDAQMSLEKAIRAMAGDPTARVESFFYSSVLNQLQKRPPPKSTSVSPYLSRAIQNKVSGGALSDCEAHRVAQDLAADTFKHLNETAGVVAQLLDYQSPSYTDWPDNIVFTTVISPAAATYGPNMIVIREKKPRSIDINYFNKVKNGNWYVHTRDAGEFAAPSYIPAGDVAGFQLRSGSEKSWHSIQTAFYKLESEGKATILVLDGAGRSCIDRKPDGDFVYCRYHAGQIALSPPPLSDEKVPVLGFIRMCAENEKDCGVSPRGLRQKVGAPESLDPAIIRRIESVELGGKKARFFPAEAQ